MDDIYTMEDEIQDDIRRDEEWLCDEDPDLGVSDDNWACGTLDVD